jgi:hypothetical protein
MGAIRREPLWPCRLGPTLAWARRHHTGTAQMLEPAMNRRRDALTSPLVEPNGWRPYVESARKQSLAAVMEWRGLAGEPCAEGTCCPPMGAEGGGGVMLVSQRRCQRVER